MRNRCSHFSLSLCSVSYEVFSESILNTFLSLSVGVSFLMYYIVWVQMQLRFIITCSTPCSSILARKLQCCVSFCFAFVCVGCTVLEGCSLCPCDWVYRVIQEVNYIRCLSGLNKKPAQTAQLTQKHNWLNANSPNQTSLPQLSSCHNKTHSRP